MANRNLLKSWFGTGNKPTQGQFAQWIDSFWHKEDTIAITDVQGLQTVLGGKAAASSLGTIDAKTMPAGGASGDVLAKASNADYNAVWINIDTLLGLEPLSLVNPAINVAWTIKKADGVTDYSPATSSAKNITVDKGAKVQISSTFQYPAPNGTTTKGPATISGAFGSTDPGPATPSAAFTNGGADITANTSYGVTLGSPKAGLIVSGSQVVKASGNDTASDAVSVTFLGKGAVVYSPLAVLTAGDIETLLGASGSTAFQSNKARTFAGVTAGAGNYTYYIYDAALGAITNAIQNGALPVFGALTQLANVTITNNAGASIAMIVFRSNAQNAFTGVTLAFS